MTRAVSHFKPVRVPRESVSMFRAMKRLAPALTLISVACSDSFTPHASADVDIRRSLAAGQVQFQGATLEALQGANWDCQQRVPGFISCAPPGTGLAPIPSLGENGQPVYHVTVFSLNGTLLGTAFFLRADLYHGQTCPFTGQPFVLRAIIGYFECFKAS